MIPFKERILLAYFRKEAHTKSNSKFMVSYTGFLATYGETRKEEVRKFLDCQKDIFGFNANKKMDYFSLYKSYKSLRRKFIDTPNKNKEEGSIKDFNYFYKKGYDFAYETLGLGIPPKEASTSFLGGFGAGKELYFKYSK